MRYIEVEKKESNRIEQGDIYSNVEYIEMISQKDEELSINKIIFPYVVVLSQDCDLKQTSPYFEGEAHSGDDDKKLFSVIVAPIYNEGLFLLGEHLADETIGYQMQKIEKLRKGKETTNYRNLINNETPRYHYLNFKEEVGLPNSIIDFKHFFTVDIKYLYSIKSTNFVIKIKVLYRESITQRFSNFLSKIGLP